MMILISKLLEYFLRNFFGEEIGGSGALRPPDLLNIFYGRCSISFIYGGRRALEKLRTHKEKPRKKNVLEK